MTAFIFKVRPFLEANQCAALPEGTICFLFLGSIAATVSSISHLLKKKKVDFSVRFFYYGAQEEQKGSFTM